MTQSILVVDLGGYATKAALVTGDQSALIVNPVTGTPSWPAPAGHLAGDLSMLRREAELRFATRVTRLVLTVAAAHGPDDPLRHTLIRAAGDAGHPDAELVSDAAAAVADPQTGLPAPPGLVLVCDLGATWSVALVSRHGDHVETLAAESAGAGLTRAGMTETALMWVLASCRAVVARGSRTLADVAGVLLVGGAARMPLAAQVIGSGLDRPVWVPPEPELAIIRGACHQATRRDRLVPATPATWRMEPLCWEFPSERAWLMRWLVPEGQAYPAGAVLAQIRTGDDRVFDLAAAKPGILMEQRLPRGAQVNRGAVTGMARSEQVISGDRLTRLHQLTVTGEWMLTPDRQFLMECAEFGAYVRTRSIANGTVVNEVRPSPDGAGNGRIFARPTGDLSLIRWDEIGHFSVWDLATGELTARFRSSARPLSVRVHEGQWRLAAEIDRHVQVGRYRRDVATVWDLNTGAVVDEVVGDDVVRKFTGYVEQSPAHGFSAETVSPDGRLRAHTGEREFWLRHTDGDQEVFRAAVPAHGSVHTAFSGDGRFVLARWRSEQVSCLDVWQV